MQSWAEIRGKLDPLATNRDGFLCEGQCKDFLQRVSLDADAAESLMAQFHVNADGLFHANADGRISIDEFVTFLIFGEKIPESDQVSIFREFYKDAVEKDTHLSEQERSLFIASLQDKDRLHSVLDTWRGMLQQQASNPWRGKS